MLFLRTLRRAIGQFLEDRCTQLGAALAYYTLFSLAPLMVIVIAISAIVMRSFGMVNEDATVTGQVMEQLANYVGEPQADQIGQMVQHASHRERSLVPAVSSAIILLIGATAVVGQLQASLNQIWGVAPDENGGVWDFAKKRVLSFAMIVAVAFILLVSLIISTMVQAMNNWASQYLPAVLEGWLPIVTDTVLQLLITTLLFATLFRFLPDAELTWGDVASGAFFTAILFAVGRVGISFYLSRSQVESGFGAAGGLVVLITWVYYSSLILLLGAEYTKSYAQMTGKQVKPEEGAVAIAEQEAK